MSKLSSGTHVAHFRILAKIGEGGMGVVYRAEDEKLRRVVALKVLPAGAEQDDEGRRRLLREARSAAAVHHPNIATVFDVGEADGRVFVAMELVEGRSLRRALEDGALPIREASRIALAIARALAKAHERGIVHRDLKPDNVMLDADGDVKVLDFGLAKPHAGPHAPASAHDLANAETAEQVTQEGFVLGTPGYMSPEQARGKEVDPRADVFSFGVVLYEMVTGARPFTGETTLDVIIAATRDSPVPASKRNPRVGATIERIIDRCLAKEPSDRFASGRELAAALEAAITEPITEASPASTPAPSARRSKSTNAWILLGLAATMLAGLFALPKLRGDEQASSAAASASGGAPVAAPTAIVALPPPKTANPDAAAAYAAGLQSFRDGSIAVGIRSFRHALELDPSFAAAAVQLVSGGFGLPLEQLRAWVAMALRQRASLTSRDAAVLEVVQVEWSHDSPDPEDDARRFRDLVARYPLDAELVFLGAVRERDAGHFEAGMAGFDRAMALDPAFAWPLVERAQGLMASGDQGGALDAVARCLALSPVAATCLRVRAEVEEQRGECDKVEEDARRMIALEPDGDRAYEWLGRALLSRGAPMESVEQAFDRARDFAPDRTTAARRELEARVVVPFARGDFAACFAQFSEIEKMTARANAESDVALLEVGMLLVSEEAGEEARVRALAEAYVRRLPMLVPNDAADARPFVLAARHRAHAITESEFRATREAWMKEDGAIDVSAGRPWLDYYVYPARTKDEAIEALAAMPAGAELPPPDLTSDQSLGHLYFLAGRHDEALPFLRRATQACFGAVANVLFHVRAEEDLGEVLEAKGDKAGACAAYADVLRWWGGAKPRSITADRARARARALGCR